MQESTPQHGRHQATASQPNKRHKAHPDQASVHSILKHDDSSILDDCWHAASDAIAAALSRAAHVAAETAWQHPQQQQGTHQEQLQTLLNVLLPVSKTAAAGLTADLGSAVGHWVTLVVDAPSGSGVDAPEVLAGVLGQQMQSVLHKVNPAWVCMCHIV